MQNHENLKQRILKAYEHLLAETTERRHVLPKKPHTTNKVTVY